MDKIVMKDLSLFYGENKVIDKINLYIPENKITAIIGPSGCGKTSLLRSINRLNDLIPNARVKGQILFNEKDINADDADVVAIRRKIGMIFQKPNPFPKSIFENVAFGLKIDGIKNKREITEIVEKSLRDSGLWGEVKFQLNSSALELSGGQQQRLCIARTLAIQPEVILMDEPCSALDPTSMLKIEELMKELKEQYTIILVTHNMQQASRVSDFTGFLYMGKIIEFGDTNQIFTRPKEKLTDDYISGRFA
ncbi:MAG: phosphate ABC transporter ATP-binding protein [Actinobacteria bacterium]|nr:phosphate ABC transporter ATP-binding protein [Actinomycetota bacterium]